MVFCFWNDDFLFSKYVFFSGSWGLFPGVYGVEAPLPQKKVEFLATWQNQVP